VIPSRFTCILLCCAFACANASAGANAWTPIGPDGGRVRVLAADPNNADTVYAAGDGAVWKSVDGGAHWSAARSGITEPTIGALAIDRLDSQVLYAGSLDGGGVFRSTDGGATWAAANNGLAITTIGTLAVDPTNSAIVYAGTTCCGIYKSTNRGASWTWLQGGGLPQISVHALLIDPAAPATIYAGSDSQGLFKSTNGGATWAPANGGASFTAVNGLAIAGGALYAATGSGVFKSTDGAATFAASGNGLPSNSIQSIAADAAALYAGLLNVGVYRSVDGGATWAAANAGAQATIGSLAVDPHTSRIYAGFDLGVYVSTSNGTAWAKSSTGLANSVVQSLVVDAQTPTTLYAGTGSSGVWKSIDGGATWTASSDGITTSNGGLDVRALAIDPSSTATLYAGTGAGMYKSVNGGAKWTSVDHGTLIRNISGIVISGSVIRVSTFFTGVFVSMNGGDTWATENQGLPASPLSVRSMASDGASVLAATVAPGTYGHDLSSTTWQGVGSLPADAVLGAIGAARFASSSAGAPAPRLGFSGPMYAAGSASGYINFGPLFVLLILLFAVFTLHAVDPSLVNVWQPLPLPTGVDPATCPPIKAIVGAPTPGSFYAGGACGVLAATNNGQKIAAMNAGMPPNLQVNALAVTPSGSDLYAGTQGGGVMRYTFGAQAQLVDVVEYYNQALDHYFITWVPAEQANLDAGNTPTRWTRTGFSFKAYNAFHDGASPVCRYYIPPLLGDSHFFGRGTQECASTGQKNPSFVLESSDFMEMYLPVGGVCPAGTTNVYRVFSNRADANHRYMTDKAVRAQMVAKGWLVEGDGPDAVVMCAPTS
jgi:hypothetical protein